MPQVQMTKDEKTKVMVAGLGAEYRVDARDMVLTSENAASDIARPSGGVGADIFSLSPVIIAFFYLTLSSCGAVFVKRELMHGTP